MSQPYNYPDAYAEVPARNGAALWAMVLGITALVLSLAVVGGLVGLAAAILGIVGLVKPGKKGMAITGLVTGVLSMPVAFVALFIWFGVYWARTAMPALMTSVTQTQMAEMKTGLEHFDVDVGRYPTTTEGLGALMIKPAADFPTWHGPYVTGVGVDPWGHPYVYLNPGTLNPAGYDLYSMGPDGVAGTADDIPVK